MFILNFKIRTYLILFNRRKNLKFIELIQLISLYLVLYNILLAHKTFTTKKAKFLNCFNYFHTNNLLQ